MMAMSRVAERGNVRVMRRFEDDARARFRYPIKFRHHGRDVREMLDHLIADDQIELIVRKRVRELIEVMNDVSIRLRIDVDPDRARRLMLAATEIEDLQRARRLSIAQGSSPLVP